MNVTIEDKSLSPSQTSIWKIALVQGLATAVLSYVCLVKGYGILVVALFGFLLLGLPIIVQPKFGLLLCVALNITSASAIFLGGLYLGVIAMTIFALILHNLASEPVFVRVPQNRLIYAFTAIAILSLLFAEDPARGVQSLVVYLKVVVFYMLIVNIVDSPRFLKAILWAIILSALSISLFGIYQFISAPTVVGLLNRIASTRGDPNNLALTLVSAIPLAMALQKIAKRTATKVILISTSTILFFAVALTLSRGGYLALIVVVFLLVARMRSKKRAIFLLLSVVGLSLLFLPAEVWERAGVTGVSFVDASVQMRTQLLKGGTKMFLDHLLFGVGVGNFITHSFHYSGVLPPSYAHNMFLHVAAETGIMGFCLFVALLWTTFSVLRRVQRKALREQDTFFLHVSQGLKVSLIGFCVAAFFLSQQFNKTLWILIALTASIGHIYLEPRRSRLSSKGLDTG